jgi:hypothetical protein
MDYRLLKTRGWLNEAAGTEAVPAGGPELAHARGAMPATQLGAGTLSFDSALLGSSHGLAVRQADLSQVRGRAEPQRRAASPPPDSEPDDGLDTTPNLGGHGVFLYMVEEGQRAVMRRPNGSMEVIVGPCRVWKGGCTFTPMKHFVAHPGDYLIVRFRDGPQEHLPGPTEVWFDPRIHQEIRMEEGLQLAAKEAVVVYSAKEAGAPVQRRIVEGPALFVPRPGEWLHTFSWHASQGGSKGVVKVPGGLVFQKLWLMPDQMYHDVSDVRTADDAVLTVRLMIFFELVDISTMLDATHDPIGDFVNAASSDVVDFVARHDLESFKRHTNKLNEIETYKQLTARASQCGYRINKVVYRGYGAPERLQAMHDQAIEARTKLQLERETERQVQEVASAKLESDLERAAKRRVEQSHEVEHEVELQRKKLQASLQSREAMSAFRREQQRLSTDLKRTLAAQDDARQREHLGALKDMGVDLTAFLTRGRADRVIELRGADGSTHLHLEPDRPARNKAHHAP